MSNFRNNYLNRYQARQNNYLVDNNNHYIQPNIAEQQGQEAGRFVSNLVEKFIQNEENPSRNSDWYLYHIQKNMKDNLGYITMEDIDSIKIPTHKKTEQLLNEEIECCKFNFFNDNLMIRTGETNYLRQYARSVVYKIIKDLMKKQIENKNLRGKKLFTKQDFVIFKLIIEMEKKVKKFNQIPIRTLNLIQNELQAFVDKIANSQDIQTELVHSLRKIKIEQQQKIIEQQELTERKKSELKSKILKEVFSYEKDSKKETEEMPFNRKERISFNNIKNLSRTEKIKPQAQMEYEREQNFNGGKIFERKVYSNSRRKLSKKKEVNLIQQAYKVENTGINRSPISYKRYGGK